MLSTVLYRLSCIVSDIPANREVGLAQERYFKPGDVEGLANKIQEFIDKPLSVEENRQQRDLIAQRYNWDRIADETLGVYRIQFDIWLF